MKTTNFFHRFSVACAQAVGASWTFALALAIIIVWAVTGPLFDYSDTWQLLINTGTTIITFLMVFLIQNAQNRDAEATQLKLDELIRAIKGARNNMMEVEDLSDEELSHLKQEFARMGDHPDDPVRKRLKTHLGRSRHAGHDDQHRGRRDGGDSASGKKTPTESPAAAAPRRKQVQFEEYTQPPRASQRQWT
ncbi:MAG: hypothetical protein GAK35_01360 [Herbaspirillum frisingense]|uniref:Low affinity iron permease family protein n=1 Tax=Herbaspirillum frisingense TaxID=92645 RepID=A0A7V8FY68_9BURK|nr:MAG: hypothetical protein GAK35_01360 [Herbaspirillum frisingense]